MTSDPNEVQLTTEQRQLIAELAERQGRSPQEVLDELIAPTQIRGQNGKRPEPVESAHQLGQRLGLCGALENGPMDLSSNPRYLEGFGRRVH